MKSNILVVAFSASVLLSVFVSSCKKEKEEEKPDPCANMTNLLEAHIDGVKWCANFTLTTDYTIQLTITGISQEFWNLNLELDDVAPGTYSMTEDANYAFLTIGGMLYETTNSDPATLQIIENNTTTQRIRGKFNGKFYSPLGGVKTVTNGSFDVYYTN